MIMIVMTTGITTMIHTSITVALSASIAIDDLRHAATSASLASRCVSKKPDIVWSGRG